MFGQHPGQALEAIVVAALWVIAVAVGGARAGNDQDHRHRGVGLEQQHRAKQLAATGIQADRALQDRGLRDIAQQAGNQGKAQG
ncbi:hypothetical protein D3C77_669710 [compost metagenome]